MLKLDIQDTQVEEYYKKLLSSTIKNFKREKESMNTKFNRKRERIPQTARIRRKSNNNISSISLNLI